MLRIDEREVLESPCGPEFNMYKYIFNMYKLIIFTTLDTETID